MYSANDIGELVTATAFGLGRGFGEPGGGGAPLGGAKEGGMSFNFLILLGVGNV